MEKNILSAFLSTKLIQLNDLLLSTVEFAGLSVLELLTLKIKFLFTVFLVEIISFH